MLAAGRSGWAADPGELPRALAPYHDCARRLGLDPVAVFDQVAEAGPPELRDAVRAFGRRDDVTLAAFGSAVVEAPDGPRYERT